MRSAPTAATAPHPSPRPSPRPALRPFPRPAPRPASATGPAEPPSTTSKQTSLRDATRATNPNPSVDAAVQCCLRLVDSLDHVMCRLSVYDDEPLRRPQAGAPYSNAVLSRKSSGHQASSAGGQRSRSIGVGVLPVHFKPFDGSTWESEAHFRKRAQFFAGIDWSQVAAAHADDTADADAQALCRSAPAVADRSDSERDDDDDAYFGDQYEDDCYSD